MIPYRKSNQYYTDQYDRHTIKRMKELQALIENAKPHFFIDPENPKSEKTNVELMRFELRYLDFGAQRAKDRDSAIESWIEADERKDRLIRGIPIPDVVQCSTCYQPMQFELHSFTSDDKLIFFFSCIHGHLPKKAVYGDGKEHYIKIRGCAYCGGKLIAKKKKTKNKLTITETCERCEKSEISEYDLKPDKILPVDEMDRKRYCLDFIGARTIAESVESINKIAELMAEQDDKYTLQHIEQMNIAQVELRLTEQLEAQGFLKVQFDRPKTGRSLTMMFYAQDPTERNDQASIKLLKQTIAETLFSTNWRLMATEITYVLGFLSGQIKGHILEEDLIRLYKEIGAKGSQ